MKQIFADLEQLIAVASVKEAPLPKMPFGYPVDKALDITLSIFQREGFRIFKDPKGYYGYAEIGPDGSPFGVLCHLDVVPAGTLDEWTNPPFQMVQDDKWVYGRGVQDDKGPTLMVMHALTDLMAAGYKLKQPVRFIFGLDEENNWECIGQYLADGMEVPAIGFVPDGSFPLTYAEKGLWQVQLIREGADSIELQGGVAFNVVPGEVNYTDPAPELIKELESIQYEYKLDKSNLKVIGKNAHAASPESGKNALTGLLHALHQTGQSSLAARFVSEKLFQGIHGEKLFDKNSDGASGEMTVNLGLAEITPEKQMLGLDIRYPVTIPLEYFQEQLARQAEEYGFRVEERSHIDPLYVDRESSLVKSLMAAYKTITGDIESQPQISGGATYARSMSNFVAFGAHIPGSEESVHQPNERMLKSDMKLAYDIYKEALKNLVFEEKR